MISLLKKIFSKPKTEKINPMKKFLIVGLGNIGPKYTNTRHNIGFKILDALATEESSSFSTEKLGDISTFKFKGRSVILLKPNAYMNLSGKAISFWMQKENISIENLLVITDDINLDFGTFRIKTKGSAGGHNGLKDTQEKLNTGAYPRFRFGVGNKFSNGRQVDYVLGEWTNEENIDLSLRIDTACKAIKSFVFAGIAQTMNAYNGPMSKID